MASRIASLRCGPVIRWATSSCVTRMASSACAANSGCFPVRFSAGVSRACRCLSPSLAFFSATIFSRSPGCMASSRATSSLAVCLFPLLIVEMDLNRLVGVFAFVRGGDVLRAVALPLVAGVAPGPLGHLAEGAVFFQGVGVVHLAHRGAGAVDQRALAHHRHADGIHHLDRLLKPFLAHQPVVAQGHGHAGVEIVVFLEQSAELLHSRRPCRSFARSSGPTPTTAAAGARCT